MVIKENLMILPVMESVTSIQLHSSWADAGEAVSLDRQ